ncbi:MAG: DUF1501 domain-containing protein [Planctomycetes bacterium]|nr:DUF1501 domain-containing protein [Planctomycetota bacterium]
MTRARDRDGGCREFCEWSRATRRQVLSIGTLAGLGLALPDFFRLRSVAGAAEGAGTFGRAKSVIMMFLHGGHPQHETWDPKPDAPAEVRGEFGDIPTNVPGTRISELLPLSAGIVDRLAIIRSLSHTNANHVQACLPAMTGHAHPPEFEGRGDFPPSATDFPPFGAVLDHVRPYQGNLPTWVQLGPLMTRNNLTVLHGQLPGFLGARHSPFVVDQDFVPDDVRIEALSTSGDVPTLRLSGRRDLLAEVDAQRRLLDQSATARSLDQFYGRAFTLLSSQETRRAFDLAAEPSALRDRYGRTHFGQACLLARRLAEAGVPMINVHYCKTPKGSWDTHSKNSQQMKESLGPTFDRAFSTLVADMDERGLLDETLVIATAEFGRTPQINKNAGRDHWPWVYSIALTGAGIQRGMVYGSSDRLAAYPQSKPHDPRDFAATVYHLLGIPAETVIYDSLHRPHQLIIGRPISGILA